MSATAIANAVDPRFREAREAEYMAAVKRYSREEVDMIASSFAELVLAMEHGAGDILGETFMALELGNKWHGQFFTPYHICKLMAGVSVVDFGDIIEAKGFVSANEPTCGGGAMIIALAESMREAGLNPQQQLHVVAQDIDEKCVHMCFLQLSLLNIPAVVIHGNTLAMEELSHWYTPAHILGFWDTKLRRGHLLDHGGTQQSVDEIPIDETDTETCAPIPVPVMRPIQQSLF